MLSTSGTKYSTKSLFLLMKMGGHLRALLVSNIIEGSMAPSLCSQSKNKENAFKLDKTFKKLCFYF